MHLPYPAILTLLLLAAFPGTAHASTFEFFEGNRCTQKKLGSINEDDHLTGGQDRIVVLSGNVTRLYGITVTNQPWHDEARSVLITTNWKRKREPRTARLDIYDNPDGKTDDDWVSLIVTDATLIPPSGLCVGSFERNFESRGVYLDRRPKNGLDGKISSVVSLCDGSCRVNLTPDPNATKKQPLLETRLPIQPKRTIPRNSAASKLPH